MGGREVSDRGTLQRTVSVVGSNGFIGRRLVSILRSQGHDLHEFTRTTPVVEGGRLHAAAAESDAVVWAASSINPLIAENDPDKVALDLATFDSYLAAARGAERPPRTILLSSGGTVYDEEAEPPYSESSSIRPRNAYGRAKATLEQRLLGSDENGVVLRVANAYGPGQPVAPGQGVISHWLHAIAIAQPVHVYGSGAAARDYVYVDDIAAAVALALAVPSDGDRVFNIGSGRPTSLDELLTVVRTVVGSDNLTVERHEARGFDVRSTWLDRKLAGEALGWAPITDLRDGIECTWQSVRAEMSPGPDA